MAGIKSIISNKTKTHTSINLEINGEIITNQLTVTNKFNDFFTNIGPNLNKNIPNTEKSFSDYLKTPTQNSMFLKPTSPGEIYNIITKLNGFKAMDIYNIPVKLLKLGNNYISVQLSNIFNHSFHTGVFPSNLKTAYIIPIHKSDSKLSLNKYRPITILPIISKNFRKNYGYTLD